VIVFTTSRDLRESIVLKNLGAAHFMSKPVSPDEVYYMISFVLGEQWTTPNAGSLPALPVSGSSPGSSAGAGSSAQ
jgi:DNA-binding response OmpR family regulator